MEIMSFLVGKTTSNFWVTDFFESLYYHIFGTEMLGGVNIGFWLSMLVVVLIVLVQNLVFWCMRPKKYTDRQHKRMEEIRRKREQGEYDQIDEQD